MRMKEGIHLVGAVPQNRKGSWSEVTEQGSRCSDSQTKLLGTYLIVSTMNFYPEDYLKCYTLEVKLTLALAQLYNFPCGKIVSSCIFTLTFHY